MRAMNTSHAQCRNRDALLHVHRTRRESNEDRAVGAYKQAQTELWNAAGAATQHEHTQLLRPLYDHIVSTVSRQSPGGHDVAVLDIASGPGEPAISIARALPSCSVLATDMACNMVQTARIRAEIAGLTDLRCSSSLSC